MCFRRSIAAEVGGLVAGDAGTELVVVAGQDRVEQHAREAAIAMPVIVTSALPRVKVMPLMPRPLTKMTAAMMRLRDFVRSTRFSTTLRTPTAAIMP